MNVQTRESVQAKFLCHLAMVQSMQNNQETIGKKEHTGTTREKHSE